MKVLLVCTSHDTFPVKTGKTGLWLSELTSVYAEFRRKKLLIDIASPGGGIIPVDPRSQELKEETDIEVMHSPEFLKKFQESIPLSEIDGRDYRLVYFAGGHGCLWDYPENQNVQKLVREVYEHNGFVTAVGHGVSALLNVMLSDGSAFVQGKYITAFSNMEEKVASFVSETPFYIEDKLKEKGAFYTKALFPFVEFIEMDERLITGQNPSSARKVASKALEELFEK